MTPVSSGAELMKPKSNSKSSDTAVEQPLISETHDDRVANPGFDGEFGIGFAVQSTQPLTPELRRVMSTYVYINPELTSDLSQLKAIESPMSVDLFEDQSPCGRKTLDADEDKSEKQPKLLRHMNSYSPLRSKGYPAESGDSGLNSEVDIGLITQSPQSHTPDSCGVKLTQLGIGSEVQEISGLPDIDKFTVKFPLIAELPKKRCCLGNGTENANKNETIHGTSTSEEIVVANRQVNSNKRKAKEPCECIKRS